VSPYAEVRLSLYNEAKAKIEAWRKEYNKSRPHQALSELTPSEFAVKSRHLSTSGVIGGAGT
jgi:transposase InsO family protein